MGLLKDTALFSPSRKLKDIKKAAVYDAELWRAHYRHICPHHGRNLTVSYNLKLSECQSADFYCRGAATAPLLIPHFLSKWKEHKSSVSLKPTTIRVGRFHLSSIITKDSSAVRAEEGVTGVGIQVRQRGHSPVNKGGNGGAGKGQTGHFLACSKEPFIWMEMSVESIRSTAPG